MFIRRFRPLISSSSSLLSSSSKANIFSRVVKMSVEEIETATVNLTIMPNAAASTAAAPAKPAPAPAPAKEKKASKNQKEQEYLIKTPKGTRDFNPRQMAVRDKVFRQITECFQLHGAVTIDTPVFERKEVLTQKYGEDSKLIFDLADQSGELCALRYDLTVPFARYLAMNKIQNIKRYQIGKVYRRDQPCIARGRFREFYQCDFDIAGTYDKMLPDSECVKMMCDILEKMDVGEYQVKINHRKLLDGMFEVCGVSQDKIRSVSSSIDKLDKTEWAEVRQELITQKGIEPSVADKIGEYTKFRGDGHELVAKLKQDSFLTQNKNASEALDELELLFKYCKLYQVNDKIVLDMSLARGLDYYTGVIYEAILKGPLIDMMIEEQRAMFEAHAAARKEAAEKKAKSKGVKKEKEGEVAAAVTTEKKATAEEEEDDEVGSIGGVGSVAGGGRYDELVNMFDKKSKVPCVGFSIGVERLFAVMEAKYRRNNEKVRINQTEVYIVSAQKGLVEERMKLCQELWAAGIKVEHSYKENPKSLNQFQYCEEHGVPYCVVIGEDEIKNNYVTLRNASTRAEDKIPRSQLIEELKKRLAQ